MNTKRKLIVGVLAFLVVMTMGYALFSETVNVGGTLNAEGDFSVDITSCEPGYNRKVLDALEKSNGLPSGTYNQNMEQGGYANDKCVIDKSKKSVSVSTELLYPTAGRYFTVKVTNTGNLDALLPFDNINNPIVNEKKYADGVTPDHTALDPANANGVIEKDKDYFVDELNFYYYEINPLAFEDKTGTYIYANKSTYIEKEFIYQKNLRLKPGNSAYFLVQIDLPDSFEYTLATGLYYEAGVHPFITAYENTMQFPFKQMTN